MMAMIVKCINGSFNVKLMESYWTRILNFRPSPNEDDIADVMGIEYQDYCEDIDPYLGYIVIGKNYVDVFSQVRDFYTEWMRRDLEALSSLSYNMKDMSAFESYSCSSGSTLSGDVLVRALILQMFTTNMVRPETTWLTFFPKTTSISDITQIVKNLKIQTHTTPDNDLDHSAHLAHIATLVITMNAELLTSPLVPYRPTTCTWVNVVFYFSIFYVITSHLFNMIGNAGPDDIIPPFWLHLRTSNTQVANAQHFSKYAWVSRKMNIVDFDRMFMLLWIQINKNTVFTIVPDHVKSSTTVTVAPSSGNSIVPISISNVVGIRGFDHQRNAVILDVDDVLYGLYAWCDANNMSPRIFPIDLKTIERANGLCCTWFLQFNTGFSHAADANVTASLNTWFVNKLRTRFTYEITDKEKVSATIVSK